MTSSLALKKRKEMCPIWNFGYADSPLGGWEDHYITPGGTHECHPNYKAIPIGNPYGFMVCIKRRQPPQPKAYIGGNLPGENQNGSSHFEENPQDGYSQGSSHLEENPQDGYHKYMVNLYDPNIKEPIQPYNPYYMKDRRTPYQADLIREDYLDRDFKYNGTGIQPIHVPPGNGDQGQKYFEYGYSYIDKPPYKYDVSRLQQPYPVWKAEKEYLFGESKNLDKFSQIYDRRRV